MRQAIFRAYLTAISICACPKCANYFNYPESSHFTNGDYCLITCTGIVNEGNEQIKVTTRISDEDEDREDQE